MKDKVKWMNKENKNKDSKMKCDFVLTYFSFLTSSYTNTGTKHLLLLILTVYFFYFETMLNLFFLCFHRIKKVVHKIIK